VSRFIAMLLSFFLATEIGRADTASDLLTESGLERGLIVHLDCGDGRLTTELHKDGRFIVQGLAQDQSSVELARKVILEQGLYGRVSVESYDGVHLPYIDNMVNGIIVSGKTNRVSKDEIMRVLVPNGVAIMDGKRVTKPWPDEIDDWTHWLHGPGNNAVSHDKRVGISRNLQWIMPPNWGRHHNLVPSMSIMVSANGRIYYIIDEAPIAVKGSTDRWALVCRDAFNGLVLWKRPIPNWGWDRWSDLEFGGVMRFKRPDQLFRRLVAVGDVVYVTLGFNEPLVAIDGPTGEIIREYEGTENTSAILCKDDLLILTRNLPGSPAKEAESGNDRSDQHGPGKSVMAVEARTGKRLWEKPQFTGVTSRGDELMAFTDAYLTMGEQNVFLLDEQDIVALDMRSGEEKWKTARPPLGEGLLGHYDFNFVNFCSLVYQDNRLFLGQFVPSAQNLNGWQQKDMIICTMDASTGRKLWDHRGMSLAHFTPPDLFVNKGMVWTMKKDVVSLVGLDVRTGEEKKEYPVKDMLVGHHHRCYRNKATENLYLAGEEGIEYIDFESGELDVHHWMRGACAFGILPANGLIYLPTHACGCHSNVKLKGFIALSSRGDELNRQRVVSPENRLTKGPDYPRTPAENHVDTLAATDSDWPVYKHDKGRSNSTSDQLPTKMRRTWTAAIGGRITAPVIVGNSVYVGGQDDHQLYCLDVVTGDVKWQVTLDGPIDSPPTWNRGKLFVGSRGGSVYAFAADSGQLIWRFIAAPSHLRLLAFNHLESPWPVHGSTFVNDDTVYCVAGRSMHLDSGMYAYALDTNTGAVMSETRLQANVEPKGEVGGAVLPDILVGDDSNIFMRDMWLDPNDLNNHGMQNKKADRLHPNDGGLLDTTWFNSSFWRYQMVSAQMLVFDTQSAYGVKAQNKLVGKSYGQDIFSVGDGYHLFRTDLAGNNQDKETRRGTKKKADKGHRPQWEVKTTVRAQSMVLTNNHLVIAGAPDVVDDADPWGAFDDRKGGMVEIYTKSAGTRVAAYELPSAPIYDGIAVAGGRLFVTLSNGSVVCMSPAEAQ